MKRIQIRLEDGAMCFSRFVLLMLALSLPMQGYAEDDDSLSTDADSSATASKVKSALERDQMLRRLDIKVRSDDLGAVHLSGAAKSQAEVSQAAIIARSVSGVVSVQNDIVIDNPEGAKKK